MKRALIALLMILALPVMAVAADDEESGASSGDSSECVAQECHVGIMEKEYVHKPLQEGDCASCHQNDSEGKSKCPDGPFRLVEEGDDLCYSCHNKKELLDDDSDTASTGFMDGKTNLHQLHMDRKKFKCTKCHEAHSAGQPMVMREKTPFGKLSYPLRFTKTDDGGSCVVGCHVEREYSRSRRSK